MSSHDVQDIILAAITDLKDDLRAEIGDVKDHLRILNGRTAKVEASVQTHWILWSIVGAVALVFIPIVVGAFTQ
jgi:hypothetical protein